MGESGGDNGRTMMKFTKRTVIAILLLTIAVSCVYMAYFRHPPPEEILAANSKSLSTAHMKNAASNIKLFNDGRDHLRMQQVNLWEKWTRDNEYIVIGEYYSNCEEDALLIGKVALVKDKKYGGVKSFHVFNATWENDVDEGTLFLEVQYNGQDLYSNHFDMCTSSDEDSVINCPYKAGPVHISGDVKIPNYIPKGRYTCKARLKHKVITV
ncbi:PREDICTED: phosphatidylglycerol/phosphatidylinositol transfer protein-like, partial [Priapulus caudatus]|uniref:Phosphatidylglycerol/phosphatidylinositol transfer protein-like n=1 Tax=Priapulus caudatus TaxID=37621 RepID=A0ABM1EI00_PRICU